MLSRQFDILKLLQARHSPKSRELSHESSASEHTAAGCVESLASAGIPVTYNRDNQAYELERRSHSRACEFSDAELRLLHLGLKLFAPLIPTDHRNQIHRLQAKIVSRGAAGGRLQINQECLMTRVSSLVEMNVFAILTAQRLGKDLIVHTDTDGGPITLKRVTLCFTTGWRVQGLHDGMTVSHDLKSFSVMQIR